ERSTISAGATRGQAVSTRTAETAQTAGAPGGERAANAAEGLSARSRTAAPNVAAHAGIDHASLGPAHQTRVAGAVAEAGTAFTAGRTRGLGTRAAAVGDPGAQQTQKH